MKRFFLIAMAAVSIASCKDAPKADKAETSEAQEIQQTTAPSGTTYSVDIQQSKVEWVGTKPTGRHHGTFKIKEGGLTTDNNNVAGGRFVMDVKSLQADDQDEAGNTKLTNHLKSADFFDAEKYPEAVFEITNITSGVDASNKDLVMKDATHTVTGNFKMKDQTKSITFPAKITVSDAEITADANFNIDRTHWGMNYRSDKSLGDKLIDPIVNIQFHIVAKK